MTTPTMIVAYLALFAAVGIVFVLAALLVGRLLRTSNPHEEKGEIYECGEPTIGSSFIQFDLRFYVVALLFLIVEVAFFYPWATVFGKSTHLADERLVTVEGGRLTPAAEGLYRELGVENPTLAGVLGDAAGEPGRQIAATAGNLAWLSVADIAFFFAVLLVGFAYVWKRGDLDWVRAVGGKGARGTRGGPPENTSQQEPVPAA